MSGGGGRGELAVERVPSLDWPVLHVRGGILQHLQQERADGGRPANRSTAAARAGLPARTAEISEGDRYPDGKDCVGDPGHRRRNPGERPDGDRRRLDLLRRRQRRICGGGCEPTASLALAFQHGPELEGRSDDLHSGRKPVHRHRWRVDDP